MDLRLVRRILVIAAISAVPIGAVTPIALAHTPTPTRDSAAVSKARSDSEDDHSDEGRSERDSARSESPEEDGNDSGMPDLPLLSGEKRGNPSAADVGAPSAGNGNNVAPPSAGNGNNVSPAPSAGNGNSVAPSITLVK